MDEPEDAAVAAYLQSLPLLQRARYLLPNRPSFRLSLPFGRVKTGAVRVWRAILEAHGAASTSASDGNAAQSAGGASADGTTAAGSAGTNAGSGRPNHLDFPSFWAFFTSRYSIVLLLLSLLVNRIHAVVPPARARYRSSKRVRAIVRAPAILLLGRACFLIIGMIARLSGEDALQGRAAGFVKLVAGSQGEIIQGSDHSQIMWACFVAASAAVCCESFNRAIDHDLIAVVPINLFTLGLLLHFHSSPYSDPICPPAQPTYWLLLVSMLEILALHVAAVPGWRARLFITGTFTVASRSLMVFFYFFAHDKTNHTTLMPAIQSLGRILPEAFFVVASTMTIGLRALAQLFTEGKVTKEIFGHSSALPSLNDDAIIALIKYGSAALETTALKGLNNEVSSLTVPEQSYVELQPSSAVSALPAITYGSAMPIRTTERGSAVLTAHPSFPSITQLIPSSASSYSNEIRTIRALPSANLAEIDPMSRTPSLRKEMWRFMKAIVLVWKVYVVGWLAERSGVRRLAARRGRVGRWLRWCGVQEQQQTQASAPGRTGVAQDLRRLVEGKSTEESKRLLQGLSAAKEQEDTDDVDDLDWQEQSDRGGDETGESSSEDEDADEETVEEGEDEGDEASLMPGDIRARSVTPAPAPLEEINSLLEEQRQANAGEGMTSLLLAHMSASGQVSRSPMTRRRYNALVQHSSLASRLQLQAGPSDMALTTAIASRRAVVQSRAGQEEWDDSTFRSSATCVVCCAEPRSIVFWPCRCLTTCDDCRQELAARSTGQGGSSLCPCCRMEIQGYSRIHLP